MADYLRVFSWELPLLLPAYSSGLYDNYLKNQGWLWGRPADIFLPMPSEDREAGGSRPPLCTSGGRRRGEIPTKSDQAIMPPRKL